MALILTIIKTLNENGMIDNPYTTHFNQSKYKALEMLSTLISVKILIKVGIGKNNRVKKGTEYQAGRSSKAFAKLSQI